MTVTTSNNRIEFNFHTHDGMFFRTFDLKALPNSIYVSLQLDNTDLFVYFHEPNKNYEEILRQADRFEELAGTLRNMVRNSR